MSTLNVGFNLHSQGRLLELANLQSKKHERQSGESEVDVLNLVTSLDQTPIFEWYVVWWGSKNREQKGTVSLKGGWIAFSKYDNHLRFNCHDNILFLIFISFYFLGGRPLNEHENIHFDNE